MRVNWRMMVFPCGLQYLFFIIMWLEFLLYTGRSKVPMTDVNIDIITKWPELLHDRFTIYRHVKNALMLTLIVTYQRTFRASMFLLKLFHCSCFGEWRMFCAHQLLWGTQGRELMFGWVKVQRWLNKHTTFCRKSIWQLLHYLVYTI